ncbi:MAG: DNRLRE domain-containing protein, partial [bacterium]|nr:DNRLRE domain-containing protein [bacterium]
MKFVKSMTSAIVFTGLVVSFWNLASLAQRAEPEPRGMLWVAGAAEVRQFGTRDGALLAALPAGGAQDVVVDAGRRRVWLYAGGNLSAYDFDSEPIWTVPVGVPAAAAKIALVGRDGSLWLAAGQRLLHFGPAGQRLNELTPATAVRALRHDSERELLWVATPSAVTAYDAVSGLEVRSWTTHAPIRDLEPDGTTGAIWVATTEGLGRYDDQGTIEEAIPIGALTAVAGDGQGGVWAATADRELLRIDPEGELTVALRPFTTERPIRDLVADTATLSAWLTDGHTVVKVDETGRIVDSLSFGEEIYGLAIHSGAPERIPPHLDSTVDTPMSEKAERTVILTAVADTYLRRGTPNQNQGDETFLRVRAAGQNRALVRFDLASVAPLVDTLHSATLELFIEHNGGNWGAEGRTVDAYRLLVDWSELDATWNCPDDANLLNQNPNCDPQWNGGTFDPLARGSVLHENGLLGWIQYDVTRDVDVTLAGEEAFGWLLKKTAEGESGLVQYTSREGTPGQAPRLVLVYDDGEPIDEEPPEIFLASPADGTLTNQRRIAFIGSLSEPATLTLNGAPVAVDPDNQFHHGPVGLAEGSNLFQLAATDAAGNTGELAVTVTLDTVAPAAVDADLVTVGEPQDGTAPITGAATSAEPGAAVTITNTRTDEAVTVEVAADGSFAAGIAAQPEDVLSLVVTDPAGNASPAVDVTVPGELVELPPDPATVAPPLNRTVVTDLFIATEFLYTGDDPIQVGVEPGTIEARRAAVIRGRVLDRAGAPLPGVTISTHDHPEFGSTMSRADGVFDLVVNGGGVVTLRYEKAGFPAVHRILDTPWRDFVWVEDVVLIPFDPAVTTIAADAPAFQVARGTSQEDADGTRTATLVFPPGMLAEMVLGDGTRQPLASLSVRATEYTVGDTGPAAMPAPLPSNVGYTYAVELSADEAVAAGAVEVRFDQAVFLYVENFIDFATGGPVPIGYYDRRLGRWIGGENGRVVEVLGTDAQGRVELDVDGSGLPADAQQLAELGISDGEREQLAALYQAGQSLWRSPITHFTPWDLNWPYAPPQDAEPPPSDDPDDTDDDEGGDD